MTNNLDNCSTSGPVELKMHNFQESKEQRGEDVHYVAIIGFKLRANLWLFCLQIEMNKYFKKLSVLKLQEKLHHLNAILWVNYCIWGFNFRNIDVQLSNIEHGEVKTTEDAYKGNVHTKTSHSLFQINVSLNFGSI